MGPLLIIKSLRLAWDTAESNSAVSNDQGLVSRTPGILTLSPEVTPRALLRKRRASISYQLEGGGEVSSEVCYWGDMVFAPHLFNLHTKVSLRAILSFAPGHSTHASRKTIALLLQSKATELAKMNSPLKPHEEKELPANRGAK